MAKIDLHGNGSLVIFRCDTTEDLVYIAKELGILNQFQNKILELAWQGSQGTTNGHLFQILCQIFKEAYPNGTILATVE